MLADLTFLRITDVHRTLSILLYTRGRGCEMACYCKQLTGGNASSACAQEAADNSCLLVCGGYLKAEALAVCLVESVERVFDTEFCRAIGGASSQHVGSHERRGGHVTALHPGVREQRAHPQSAARVHRQQSCKHNTAIYRWTGDILLKTSQFTKNLANPVHDGPSSNFSWCNFGWFWTMITD